MDGIDPAFFDHVLSKRAPLSIEAAGYNTSATQYPVVASLGAEAIGVWVSNVIWGINIVHFIRYFTTFRDDHWLMKSTVVLLLFMDIITSIMYLRLSWFWDILNWGNVNSLAVFDYSFFVDVAMTGLTPTIVQTYFTYRVYVVSGKRAKIMPVIIMFCAIWQAAWCLTVLALVYDLGLPDKIHSALWAVYCWFLGGVVADLLITVNMLYWIYYARTRTEFKPTRNVLDKFTVIVFETNALTTLGALSILVVFATTNEVSLAYNAITYVVTKWYTLSLLIATNSRIALRQNYDDRSFSGVSVPSQHRPGASSGHQRNSLSRSGMRSKPEINNLAQGIKVTNFTVVDSEIDPNNYVGTGDYKNKETYESEAYSPHSNHPYRNNAI